MQVLIEQAGWRTACWTLGLLILVVLAPINLLLRKRPQDLGLQPDGDAAPAANAERASNVVDHAWASIDWTLARAMRTQRFWWLALAFFCGLYGWYAVQVHQTKYLIEIGFSRQHRRMGARLRQPGRHSGTDLARPSLGPDRPRMDLDRRAASASPSAFWR